VIWIVRSGGGGGKTPKGGGLAPLPLLAPALFGLVSKLPQERLPKQALLEKVKGKSLVERPRTYCEDYTKDLGRNRLGLQPSEIWKWWRTVMLGGSILSCCPRNPHGHERALKAENNNKKKN